MQRRLPSPPRLGTPAEEPPHVVAQRPKRHADGLRGGERPKLRLPDDGGVEEEGLPLVRRDQRQGPRRD